MGLVISAKDTKTNILSYFIVCVKNETSYMYVMGF